jgi:hypothetical protein
MESILERFAEHSDIGHIALLFWAVAASALVSRTMKDLAAANRRFDEFVRELARFNQRHGK